MALVDLLISWSIKPVAVTEHSSGKITAAYCVRDLSYISAIKVVFYCDVIAVQIRAEDSKRGTMLSVALSEEDVQFHIVEVCRKTKNKISVGCINSPKNVIVTDDIEDIEAFRENMEARRIFVRKFQVGIVYHFHHMQNHAADYIHNIQGIIASTCEEVHEADVLIFSSSRDGLIISEELCRPEYWTNNLVSKVGFSESLRQMTIYLLEERKQDRSKNRNRSGKDILLEIGLHSALQRPVKDTIKEIPDARNVEYDFVLSRDLSPVMSLANMMRRLCCRGCYIDLTLINTLDIKTSELQTLTDLSAYLFNHSQSYWTESRVSKSFRFQEYERHELLGVREIDWNLLQSKWRNVIQLVKHSWIHDHKIC